MVPQALLTFLIWQAFLDAAGELGYRRNQDFNDWSAPQVAACSSRWQPVAACGSL